MLIVLMATLCFLNNMSFVWGPIEIYSKASVSWNELLLDAIFWKEEACDTIVLHFPLQNNDWLLQKKFQRSKIRYLRSERFWKIQYAPPVERTIVWPPRFCCLAFHENVKLLALLWPPKSFFRIVLGVFLSHCTSCTSHVLFKEEALTMRKLLRHEAATIWAKRSIRTAGKRPIENGPEWVFWWLFLF